jgi:hypothetical protein
LPIGLKGNSDGSGAIQIGGSDAISISTGLNTTFAGTITATGTVAGTTGTLYPLVSGTAVASTSGTAIDFTGIPSWAKRITVMFNGVSTNGSSATIVQIGSGSVTTSGYSGRSGYIINAGASSVASSTSGFATDAAGAASEVRTGIMTIALIGSNLYVASCQICSTGSALFGFGNGAVTLGGVLDRVRITTINGTDTFDAGSINLLWE